MAKRQLLFPALILLFAAVVRFTYLDIKPPHFDEGINGWFRDQMTKTGYYPTILPIITDHFISTFLMLR